MKCVVLLLAGLLSGLVVTASVADHCSLRFKILPDDGAPNDQFGFSVSACGSIAIVGTPLNDAPGAAYLFDVITGEQLAKLIPDDGHSGLVFGWSVSVGGPPGNQIAVVGAPWDNENGNMSGSVYLFDVTTKQQIAKLTASDGAVLDEFGSAVAIDETGTTLVVGARGQDELGSNSGAAYLFDTTTGQQIAKLLADDGEADDWFGVSVSISSGVVAIGAMLDDDNGDDSGSAYLFDSSSGRQISKLLPDDGAEDDRFGNSVAIGGPSEGQVVVVGARRDDDNGPDSGAAYLFDATTGQQMSKLLGSDSDSHDAFGFNVSIGGPTGNSLALIGAPLDSDLTAGSGTAFLFDVATGQQVAKFIPDDDIVAGNFGIAVTISGTTAVVSGDRDNDNGHDSGSAYILNADGAPECASDLNCDGVVGFADLILVLETWGPCEACPADIHGDGLVDLVDLLIVLSTWGDC